MRPLILLLVLATAGCAGREPYDRFDDRMRSLRHSSELDLITAMGRLPERSHAIDGSTKILQWRQDSQVAPIGGMPAQVAPESCVVEWMVVDGKAAKFRWEGHACRA